MSSQPQQTTVLTQQPLTSGRFQTSVNSLDENGRAYSPGQTPTGPRRVGPGGGGNPNPGSGGLPSDPFWTEVVPLGDTPWLIMALLALLYIASRVYMRARVH